MSKMYTFLNKNRRYVLASIDTVIAVMTYLSAFVMSGIYSEAVAEIKLNFFLEHFWIYTIIFVATFVVMGVYNSMWRYAGVDDLFTCLRASLIANTIFTVLTFVLNMEVRYYVYFVIYPVSTLGTMSVRIIYRALLIIITKERQNHADYINVMLIGAGEATVAILGEISSNNPQNYDIKCIVDDDDAKIGRKIKSVPVSGTTKDIEKLCEKYEINEIILSIPSIDKDNKKRILNICAKTKCKLKIMPEVYSLLSSDAETALINKIRDVQVDDLLGREVINLNCELTEGYVKGKNILVTGGGGSIGSELCRQIARHAPNKLIILDIYENNAYEIEQELILKYEDRLNIQVEIASIRDMTKLEHVFETENIHTVFHAAAHKHVPLMEHNPEEAIKNNIIGTYNTAKVAYEQRVEKFVLISTDKAVNPTNIMGATKRVAEMIMQYFDTLGDTDFVAVRFGNVLGSNGSVIPLFKTQVQAGGPVTITHPEIIRYFMTIPEAVQLVLQAGAMANGGEIFVLDMGQPVKIKDLAYNLIRLSGLEPEVDIEIKYTGLRPGEKMYEELLISESTGQSKTDKEKIFIEKPIQFDEKILLDSIELLKSAVNDMDKQKELKILKELVPSYKKQ